MATSVLHPWDGTCLSSGYLAFAVFASGAYSPGTTAKPVIAAASNAQETWLVPAARLGDFLRMHATVHVVCHGAGELHRLLHDHLAGDPAARQVLWDFVASSRLSDVGLLDQLLRIADSGHSRPRRLPLPQLAEQHAQLAL